MLWPVMDYWGSEIQTLTLGAQLTNVMTCHGLLGVRDTDSNTGGSANPAAQPADSSSVMLMQTIGPPNLHLTHQVTTSNAQVAHSAQRSTSCGAWWSSFTRRPAAGSSPTTACRWHRWWRLLRLQQVGQVLVTYQTHNTLLLRASAILLIHWLLWVAR